MQRAKRSEKKRPSFSSPINSYSCPLAPPTPPPPPKILSTPHRLRYICTPLLCSSQQGLVVQVMLTVVQRSISANLGLNFHPGFPFLFLSKAFYLITLFILFRACNHQIGHLHDGVISLLRPESFGGIAFLCNLRLC